MVIMNKKGNPADLKNYRPIILPLYKLLITILIKRLTPKLDFYQTIEQAQFRSRYSSNDDLLPL